MSVTTAIENILNHLKNAYNELQGLGADLTNVNKNIENISMILDNIYDSMPQVSGEDISLTLNNTRVGKIKSTLKGNTSQDGEPTPDSPVDVNVVSGSNVINTSNKNLLSLPNGTYSYNNVTAIVNKGIITINGTPLSAPTLLQISLTQPIKLKQNDSIKINVNNSNGIGTNSNYVSFRLSGTVNGVSNDNITDIKCTNANANKTFTATNDTTINRVTIRGNTNVIFNNFIIKPQIELGTTTTTYEQHQGKEFPLDLGSIELCKIGTYQDYFYKGGSKWYLHKEIEKLTGNDIISTLAFTESTSYSDSTYLCCYNNGFQSTKYLNTIAYCNKFNGQYHYVKNKVANSLRMGGTSLGICVLKSDFATVNDLNSYFNTNGNDIFVYMVPITPTNTEITDTTLINQLNALEQAMSYDDQTNISQENDNLPFIINATALMKNSD